MGATAEDIIQVQVIEFVKQCTDLPVIHIANQRQTSPQHGALLKRMGVRKGCADLFFPRSNHSHKGMWMELKTLTGKPSIEQITFLDDMAREGYFTCINYGAEEAIGTIKIFYDLPRTDHIR